MSWRAIKVALSSVAALVCIAMEPVFITVIGRHMGAGDMPAAERGGQMLRKKHEDTKYQAESRG